GESLRERLARERELPVHDAVKILAEVVDALAAAHALGVVHRDIKPDNVILSGRHALVADFGVAKAVSEATGRQRLTTAGVALGTPAYMAPEQATADPHLDHRVDIYAVGAMGYELLTGSPPFSGGSSQEILAAQVTRAPEPIASRRPAIPPSLAAVIMKCLEKRPADRWQTAEEHFAQLEPLATPSGGMTPTQTRPVQAVGTNKSEKSERSTKIVIGIVAVAVLAIAGALLVVRKSGHTPVTLRDRRQITSSGRVSQPVISPDGKQLAYVVTDCGEGGCRYGVELQDLGTGATRRVMDSATAAYGIVWSPDRRNLLFTGTIAGRYGTYLVSLLGGAPRWITSAQAGFWAGGDSLLVSSFTKPDSVFWLRVAGLDGVTRDSIHVAGVAEAMFLTGAVPGSPWIVVSLWRPPIVEFLAIDRRGHIAGTLRVKNAQLAQVTGDALWLGLPGAVMDAPSSIVRVPFNPRTGSFSEHMDTLDTARGTWLSVTADGSTLVVPEGSAEFSAWALDLGNALQGRFDESRLRLKSTSPIGVWLSQDGSRVILRRIGAASDGGDQLASEPFSGGAESPLAVSGTVVGYANADSVTVALAAKTVTGLQFSLVDLRTGSRRNQFVVPDSTIGDFAALPEGGWVWIAPDLREIRVQRHGEGVPRTFAIPDWYRTAFGIAARGGEVAFVGWNTPDLDSTGLSVMSLADGKVTHWATLFSEGSIVEWLSDGTILLANWETPETVTLYRVHGPGRLERLGTIPRAVPVGNLIVSSDRRRVGIVTRESHGDAWMSRVAGR
ncbi:MAG: protein kinase, partial [Gemmatimonadales bacterium]